MNYVCRVDRGKLTRFEVGKSEYQYCVYNANVVYMDQVNVHLAWLKGLDCRLSSSGNNFEVSEKK